MSEYILKGNLSEKQIESDVSGFFGWISKGTPFRLLDVDEQLTGSDKKFYDSGFAFFMQFKVSTGLLSVDKLPPSTRSNRSPLECIREFRKEYGLQDDPSLYFGLRALAKNAHNYQHNILLNYTNQTYSQDFYVAPLHLNKDDYYNCLFDSTTRFRSHPFYDNDYRLFQRDWVSHIGAVPFLKEHVSIIPHERVDTHKHHYSYSVTGGDIGWHSPQLISKKPSRLSDVLSKEIEDCIFENRFSNLLELVWYLKAKSDDIEFGESDPIEIIQEWGRNFYSQHGVKLFLLLGNSKYINSFTEQNS